jgi:hypothetical protein
MREVAKLNPELLGVLDIKDYNERQSGQRTLDDDRLAALIVVIGQDSDFLGKPRPTQTQMNPSSFSQTR